MIDGFPQLRPGIFVRAGEVCAEELGDLLVAIRAGSEATADGGRGTAQRVVLPDGRAAWRRSYRHGGLIGRWIGDMYAGWRTRPETEIRAVETARAAGILAPAALAYGVWRSGPFYRAALVSEEIPQRRSLRAVLTDSPGPDETRAWVASLVRDVRRLHGAGVHHPDLNLTNMLAATPGEPLAFLDFDRARVFAGPVPAAWRRLAARRLQRSLDKLPPNSGAAGVFPSLWRDS